MVSAHPLSTSAGIQVLQKDGNAVDASIAVQLALAVVYPRAGNLGGGGFMVLHTADGQQSALDFREVAPKAAHRNMYLNEDGNAISELSRSGHLAVGVPGTVDGLIEAHRAHGRIEHFKELVKPAIKLARHGFRITEFEAKALNEKMQDFREFNTVSNIFLEKQSWAAGDLIRNRDLAKVLRRIKVKGRRGFYEGKTAELILDEMDRGNGIVTSSDLKGYHSKWRPAIRYPYKDIMVVSMPPPSSGGIVLGQMLGMTAQFPLKSLGFQSTESVHLMTEIERRAYADRARHLGDDDFQPVPTYQLLSDSYLSTRMRTFDSHKATPSKDIEPGIFESTESEETTHLSVLDQFGNAVAVTTTLNSSYGSKVVVGGGGFFLNNEMDDFSAKPGVPNLYGLVGGEANAIAPGKRMLSSMTPTIVLKSNKPYLILGTPGGATIITSVYQVIINVVEFGLSLEDAVNSPRFHHQWLPDKLFIEADALDHSIRQQLGLMGHQVEVRSSIGKVDAILVEESGNIIGVGDHRADDTARGY